MAQDQNKKTLRSFQCRDYLWEIFEQMSQELECSVDYLINESMRQYARSRNYAGRTTAPGGGPARTSQPPVAAHSAQAVPPLPAPGAHAIPPLGAARPAIPSAPPPLRQTGPASGLGAYGGGAPVVPPLPPPPAASGGYSGSYEERAPAVAPPPLRAAPAAPPPLPPAPTPAPHAAVESVAPPPLPSRPPAGGSVAQRPTLYVVFNGQKVPVTKEEFVIGRGSKSADLPIKDGNISRRHAAVVYHGGSYYMKDLGSTNGVEFSGQKVGTKRIDEGDVFHICDYELRFTYH